MKEHSGMYPVKKMAVVLEVSRSRYYAWLKKPVNARKQQDHALLGLVKQIFEENRRTYGSPRIHLDLHDMGYNCSKKRVARIMRENTIFVRLKKKFKVTTCSDHDHAVAENLLGRKFFVESANKVWASDITYIWTMEGWLYLCIILDLYSRRVVGWAMDARLGASLAKNALSMAVLHRNPPEELIFHSDRGVQYASEAFRKKIKEYKMIQSMSRKGNCWDNACAESFFATLKSEEVFKRSYKTREEARKGVFEYIASFYNGRRKHSYLGYLSPMEFEARGGWITNAA